MREAFVSRREKRIEGKNGGSGGTVVKAHPPRTLEEYIAALPAESRRVAQRLRAVVRRLAPEATEAIKYGMPAFLLQGSPFFYFAVWKKHFGLYPIYEAPPGLESRIASYRHGKDAVRFALADPIDYELVALVVRFKREHHSARAIAATKPKGPRLKVRERRRVGKS